MKNQASVLLQVVDSPINTTIPAGYLSIRAKSTGLVVVDSTGTETSIGSGGSGSEFTGVTLATTSGLTGNGTSNSGLGINWSSLYAGRPVNFGYSSSGPRLTFDETTTDLKGTGGINVITCSSTTAISIGTSVTTTMVTGTLDVVHFKIGGIAVQISNPFTASGVDTSGIPTGLMLGTDEATIDKVKINDTIRFTTAISWNETNYEAQTVFMRVASTAGTLADFVVQSAKGDPGAPGADGITPHIDATTNHWMIEETDTEVNASGAGWKIPRIWYTYSDSTLGEVNRLDDTVNVLEMADRFDSLSGLKLKLQSASATISGNIYL